MNFTDLGLIDPLIKAVTDQGYTKPTPIQAQAIPFLLKKRDLLASAQTGTGKTAAFTIPILQHLHQETDPNQRRQIKALIITPTRELALQINESIEAYGKYTQLKSTVIFGGVKQTQQVNRLKQGVDILVATPGRLLDLINQGFISLKHIKYFVLDEADQMLDMGFIHDIKKVLAKLPNQRHNLFFSATMPKSIVELSSQILHQPERVSIAPKQTTAEKVGQSVCMVNKEDKVKLLAHLIKEKSADSTLVFSRTKHGANKIVKKLSRFQITAEAIHGNKSQAARVKALDNFKAGKTKVLIATDIAARGIDIEELNLVINYDLPNVAETYVHRIGRTGRAQASGDAISFCSEDELEYLRDIQKLIDQDIPIFSDHPFHQANLKVPASKQRSKNQGQKKKNFHRGGKGKRSNNRSSQSRRTEHSMN